MPIFRSGWGNAPAWCELENFELLVLAPGEERMLVKESVREHLIVCRGALDVETCGVRIHLPEAGKLELVEPARDHYVIRNAERQDNQVFRAIGHWTSITSSGIFTVRTGLPPGNDTPYDYAKTTTFDNHYHDFDEYWIILEGECTVASEGRLYDVGPGDCVATGMGWHHDVVSIRGDGAMRGVWFEGSLEGRGRLGHLWEPAHGPAEPVMLRR